MQGIDVRSIVVCGYVYSTNDVTRVIQKMYKASRLARGKGLKCTPVCSFPLDL
jgi:hypothetical protein